MKKIFRLSAVLLLWGFGGITFGQTSSLYDQAMMLNAFRQHYPKFCAALQVPDATRLVPGPNSTSAEVNPELLLHLEAILQQAKTGFSASADREMPTNPGDVFATQPPKEKPQELPEDQKSKADSISDAIELQNLIREWYYAECFVMDSSGRVNPTGYLNFQNASWMASFPGKFTYLCKISTHVQGVSETGYETAGVLSSMFGSLPQAAIIQGIVDFTIQRAKEELLQAFLQGWLDDLQESEILEAAFPKTLDLLATTDLTTIFSQGDVWKAAFQQDLDELPAHLPEIVRLILDDLPYEMNPEVKKEINGAVYVAVQLFLRLDRNQNNLSDAIRLIAGALMLKPDRMDLSYSERSVIATKVLLSAVHSSQNGVSKVVSPETLLELSESQLCDLWNVVFLNNASELAVVMHLQSTDSLYKNVVLDLSQVQFIFSKVADILQDINELMTVKKMAGNANVKNEVTFQQVHAYYQLITDLLDNGLDLAQMTDAPVGEIKRVMDRVVKPVGSDIIGMAEGIATQQYGLVITNSISLLRLLSDEVVKNPEWRQACATVAEVVEEGKAFRKRMKNYSGSAEALQNEADTLLTRFLARDSAWVTEEVKILLADTRDLIRAWDSTSLDVMKDSLKATLKQFQSDLKTAIKELKVGEGLDPVANAFNTYGRLMVNILTAENADDVKAALNDAAAPVGSYMVKQTSGSSITVAFFPGAKMGREYARAPSSVAAIGGDTLMAADRCYLGATLPIGLEFAKGIRSRLIGALGIHLQVADLGAVLNYRLANPADSVSISPEIGFAQVLAPGASFVLHVTKVPLVIGGTVSYSPQLRSITDGSATYNLSMLQMGGFVAVDVNVFQLFASQKKMRSRNDTYH